jgi:hypothetical protein
MPKLSREAIQQTLTRRYSPRIHMSLILATCGLAAMIASWSLLHLGVGSMLVRYPIAISLAYVTFLLGVWTWLRAMGFIDGSGRSTRSNLDGSSVDIPVSGGGGGGGGGSFNLARGGGSFDGGGASAAWAENQAAPMAAMADQRSVDGGASAPTLGGSKGSGGGFSIDGIDGDGLVVILLAIALVAIVFITSGYLIWCAPDVLTEAAFGAALAGTLTRSTRKQAPDGWVAGVVKKTWWPFAVVLVAAVVFAGYVHTHYPQATTFRQAITIALQS